MFVFPREHKSTLSRHSLLLINPKTDKKRDPPIFKLTAAFPGFLPLAPLASFFFFLPVSSSATSCPSPFSLLPGAVDVSLSSFFFFCKIQQSKSDKSDSNYS